MIPFVQATRGLLGQRHPLARQTEHTLVSGVRRDGLCERRPLVAWDRPPASSAKATPASQRRLARGVLRRVGVWLRCRSAGKGTTWISCHTCWRADIQFTICQLMPSCVPFGCGVAPQTCGPTECVPSPYWNCTDGKPKYVCLLHIIYTHMLVVVLTYPFNLCLG